ncbi:gem-associated protein 5 isoform X2 [Cephus cinctus]|uniref:Gem-associated protein 5 isoform X2 n=1 Tax=Cephus cinctus TaxID=211228 RepID=A0AAJ7CAD4_CEPCN|nr:gem-associated protein 5 isoform X2 [Cephus cinctus]
MNEVTFPPSPNWYLSSILACSNNGTVAWGSRNAIVIAKASQDGKIFKYNIIPNAHLDRVTSVAFSPKFGEPDNNFLVSGGDEYIARIWNLDTCNAHMAYSYPDNKQKIIGVQWSVSDPTMICCITTEGSLILWYITHGGSKKISLGKLTATCLSCCPHNSNIVAVGTKIGLVYIIDIRGSGTIMYKLRGHDVEIASLSWCPTDINIFNTGAKDLLLASGAKDRSIFIWKAGSDGRYETEIILPTGPMDSQRHRSKLGTASGGWTTVCWVDPNRLLSSSSWGELISWKLSAATKKKPTCELIHASHARGLFCIAHIPSVKSSEDESWRSENSVTVWTLAQDRQVVCCKITGSKFEVVYSVPTQGGYVYCIAACPLDTSRIAFGAGDAMLRLWNLSEPHENFFDVTQLWQKIKGKVRCISWHPEKENWLAFATGEGRVGVFDTNSSKPPVLYRQYHRHTVYTLGWGPAPKSEHFVLYSCGDTELVYYDPEKPNKDPVCVRKKECTEFSWKPDYSCLAIGFEDGSLTFLNRDLVEYGRSTYFLKKAIQCVAWHPGSTATDFNFSPLQHYLAVAVNSPTITIFDVQDLAIESSTNNTAERVPKLVAVLNGHTAKVVSLAWSPHISGYLVSGSYDNTAQVWKVESQELLGTYTGHTNPVHCCMWSPLDPDLIITGSADFTLRIWRLSEQPVIQAVEKTAQKKVRTKKSKHKTNTSQKEHSTDIMDTSVQSDTLDNSTVNGMETIKNIKDQQILTEVKSINTVETKKRKSKSYTYFTSTTKLLNNKSTLSSIRDLAKYVHASEKDGKSTMEVCLEETNKFPSFFGGDDDLTNILEKEKSVHASQGQHNMVTEMDIWTNNLKHNLQEAVKEKRLNDYLVSLAPCLSMKTWQDMCEAYASQLIFENNPNKAVSYLLCTHKIHRAIEVFKDSKMFREAYVLARCKLSPEDPLLVKLLEEWAENTVKEGYFEEAVRCYIKLGDFSKAAKYLGRRKDLASLQVAAELALLAGDQIFSDSLAEESVTEALLNSDCATARGILEQFSGIKYREVQIDAFEEVAKVLRSGNELNKVEDWLNGKFRKTKHNYELISVMKFHWLLLQIPWKINSGIW